MVFDWKSKYAVWFITGIGIGIGVRYTILYKHW